MDNIRDLIDEKIVEYHEEHLDSPSILQMDTYTYAILREELGVRLDKPFERYRGMKITVDPDFDGQDLIKII